MLLHGEVHNDRLRVVLLRAPTVVASGGYVYLHPTLSGRSGRRVRPAGFDPICALISDKDVARAIACGRARARPRHLQRRGHARRCRSRCWRAGRDGATLPLPGPLLALAAAGARLAGRAFDAALDGPHLRYGFTLDTRRAERELGFRPLDRIGLARAGDGALRLETASA